MKNIKSNIYFFKAFVLSFALLITSCGDDEVIEELSDAPSALAFDVETDSFEVENNESTYDITVQATSVSNVDRTVSVSINEDGTSATPEQYSFSPQITIPAGSLTGSTAMSFDYDILNFGDTRDLMLDLVLNEGDTPNITRQNFMLSFVKQCTLNNVTLEITTDIYPEETSWELYDLAISTTDPIMTSGGEFDPDVVADESIVEVIFCLGAGTYGVIVRDSYGDGISNGGFQIILDGSVIASGIVPGGNPANVPSFGAAQFTID